MSGQRVLSSPLGLASALLGGLAVLSSACPEDGDDDTVDTVDSEDASHDAGRDSGDGCAELDRDRDGHGPTDCGGDDCDDRSANAHPGADDRSGDGVDEDCDGVDGVDRDHDGHASEPSGGDDCDDEDPAVHPGIDEDAWAVETVPDDDRAWRCLAIAVGDDGATHMAYVADEASPFLLHHATDQGGIWAVETVFSAEGGEANIFDAAVVVGPAGRTEIADMDIVGEFSNAVIRHWRNDGDGWVSEPIYRPYQDQPLPADHFEMAVAPSGALHVLFSVIDIGTFEWATNQTGEWLSEPVGDGTAGDIAVDGSGFVHATFGSSDGLSYLSNESGEWTRSTIEGGTSSAVALDGAGRPHVVYLGANDELRHASAGEAGWQIETIDTAPHAGWCRQIGLGIDRHDALHVTYAAGDGPCEIRYATNDGGAWLVEALSSESSNLDECGSPLAVDGRRVHVVYADTALRHAARSLPDGVDDDCDGEVF